MGMDFVALMRYGGPDDQVHAALDALEADSPDEVKAVARLMHDRGFTAGHGQAAVWRFTKRPDLRDPRLEGRPTLPNLGVSLRLPEDFFLTLGPDAIEVYHLLRWHFFLTEPDLQRDMLDACACLGRLFGAGNCVITSDDSPVVHAFRGGLGFDAALASAGPEDGERPRLSDLYQEVPEGYVMQLVARPGQPARTRYRDWDIDRPAPEGWQRATTWDSHGYWRLDLGAGTLSRTEAPVLPAATRPRPTRPPADGRWWQTSDDPDAMLDFLLKQDGVSRRGVLLSACAWLRRIWPQLRTEPARRVVEVAERFADGQADQRAIENAANAVRNVRKGDCLANRAAYLLGQLGEGSYCFPPGNVSEAVIEAALGNTEEAARAAERKAHADLLRDIFGPAPPGLPAVAPAWRTQAVASLAQAAYEAPQLPAGHLDPALLAVLADALEEAGADAQVLDHCRSRQPHVRGCWLLDALTGRR